MDFMNSNNVPYVKEVVNVVDYIHGLYTIEELKKDFK